MTLTLPCPDCNGDGFLSTGDQHAETRTDVCPRCRGRMVIPAATGEAPEASARPKAIDSGRTAYEARYAHMLGPRISDMPAWDDLPADARAVWARVGAACCSPAEAFARRVHAGQVDKAGKPYTGHLARVSARAGAHAEAMRLPANHVAWCRRVGWLHDTIEDTDTTVDDLYAAGFDPAVAQAVALLTKPDGAPYFDYVGGLIASGDRIALIVKLSDLEDNSDPARSASASEARASRYGQALAMVRGALADGAEGEAL